MEDRFKIAMPKGATRPVVSEAAVQKSLDRAANVFGDAKFGMVRVDRSGADLSITYGVEGRALDAAALAYEINN
mgnify:CR=1 FL=1